MRDPSLTQDTHVDLLESAASIDREIQAAKLGLKPLQVDWARFYVGPARYSAAEASRLAGVHERTGRGWRDREDVRKYCAALIKREAHRIHVSRSSIIQELAFIAFSDVAELFESFKSESRDDRRPPRLRDLSSLPRHLSRAIKSVKFREDGAVTEIAFHDKLKALQLLGLAWRLFDGEQSTEQDQGPQWTGFQIIAPVKSEQEH